MAAPTTRQAVIGATVSGIIGALQTLRPDIAYSAALTVTATVGRDMAMACMTAPESRLAAQGREKLAQVGQLLTALSTATTPRDIEIAMEMFTEGAMDAHGHVSEQKVV